MNYAVFLRAEDFPQIINKMRHIGNLARFLKEHLFTNQDLRVHLRSHKATFLIIKRFCDFFNSKPSNLMTSLTYVLIDNHYILNADVFEYDFVLDGAGVHEPGCNRV